MKKNHKKLLPPLISKPLTICIGMALANITHAEEMAHLSGAIFTTTPYGDIVNENVRYESKEDVYLDGGPGPNAPASAAALPAGYYYFQVTDPSGKCLLSSIAEDADIDGGTCYGSSKKGGPNNGTSFEPEPLKCRLFYFDGEGGVKLEHSTYTTQEKIKGQWVETTHDCRHNVNITSYDGNTIQLFPFANTPNNGGVYKVWVSPKYNVDEACIGITATEGEHTTGVGCDGFFGFIPRWSKTDNFKADLEKQPKSFDIALRKFHDINLNCELDEYDEYVKGWVYGVTDPLGMRKPGYITSTYEHIPNAFNVLTQEHLKWLVDEYMWDASVTVNPLNTPFTHFPSFADLRTYTSEHINGEVKLTFSGPSGCTQGNILAGTEVTESFTPGNYGAAYTVHNNDVELPVLSLAFGNFGVAELTVCKVFTNKYQTPIGYWQFTLDIPTNVPIPDDINTNENSDTYTRLISQYPDFAPITNRQVTKDADENGCTTFSVLVPNVGSSGKYSIKEGKVDGWNIMGYESYEFDVISVLTDDTIPQIRGEVTHVQGVLPDSENREDISYSHGQTLYFKNNCKIEADFDTKGYWHNKNGLQELTYEDKIYVNYLPPYASKSDYFDAGDEPFDGYFEKDGEPGEPDYSNPVDAAYNSDCDSNTVNICEAGTWQSEVSHFLTDNNGNADLNDHKEQLAQQLLAFIFNIRHRGPEGSSLSTYSQLKKYDGEYIAVEDLINAAVAAWEGSDTNVIEEIKNLLDWLNNNNNVTIIPGDPQNCPPPNFD